MRHQGAFEKADVDDDVERLRAEGEVVIEIGDERGYRKILARGELLQCAHRGNREVRREYADSSACERQTVASGASRYVERDTTGKQRQHLDDRRLRCAGRRALIAAFPL